MSSIFLCVCSVELARLLPVLSILSEQEDICLYFLLSFSPYRLFLIFFPWLTSLLNRKASIVALIQWAIKEGGCMQLKEHERNRQILPRLRATRAEALTPPFLPCHHLTLSSPTSSGQRSTTAVWTPISSFNLYFPVIIVSCIITACDNEATFYGHLKRDRLVGTMTRSRET